MKVNTYDSKCTQFASEIDIGESVDDSMEPYSPTQLTIGILNVTYSGTHFFGWSAANDGYNDSDDEDNDEFSASNKSAELEEFALSNIRVSRRSRRNRRGIYIPKTSSKVRSVEGVIRKNLAKLYGNIDESLVQIEGCSRTDRGVHARSLICTFLCHSSVIKTKSENPNDTVNNNKPVGTTLKPLPCGQDLGKILFCLNRMLPPDVRIMGISAIPSSDKSTSTTKYKIPLNFHPSLDTKSKTYQYTFSVGDIHDPMRWRHVWHLDGVRQARKKKPTRNNIEHDEIKSKENSGKKNIFYPELAQNVAKEFLGLHNFTAFKGAFRGSERKTGKVVNPICQIHSLTISQDIKDAVNVLNHPLSGSFHIGDEGNSNGIDGRLVTYTVEIIGDRFMYKMVRKLLRNEERIEKLNFFITHQIHSVFIVLLGANDFGMYHCSWAQQNISS